MPEKEFVLPTECKAIIAVNKDGTSGSLYCPTEQGGCGLRPRSILLTTPPEGTTIYDMLEETRMEKCILLNK